MKRKDIVKRAYDDSGLDIKNHKYQERADQFLRRELHDDLQGMGLWTQGIDVTTKALFNHAREAKAYIKAKQSGVIAGLDEITRFYKDNGLDVKLYKNDGDRVKKGDKILELSGDAKDMLNTERTGLNLLQRMSGIATTTRKLKDKIKGYDTEIVATRKSQLRYLDKRAVKLGGGLPHRLGLHDGILIKDTHLDALKRDGIGKTIEAALEMSANYLEHPNIKFIEIEVATQDEAIRAARKVKGLLENRVDPKPCIIMLDNMKPSQIKKVISKLKKENLYDYVLLEASGMINEKTIESYARSGVDVVSMGCLTHSIESLDLSQKMEVK
ncbi:MAG: carboxylating nicotinate-nucleotide diphosphorylase [Nanoarchaeota archaeon]|nr:carboxylating nicotinate-nucleotide diphosphorylase [Nanoarchaeota archaeon]MCG2717563.1 carboxylating nicotinate-nucleotide diphosphorylase [Nanoarchaeota archaeon]